MIRDVIEVLFEQLDEHWVKFVTASFFLLIGWYFGKRKERHQWENRSFLDRLNVSLNSLTDGTLKIRTVLEKPGEEIFLNKLAVRKLIEFSRQTKPGEPLIPIPEVDRWYYLNSVLNEISEKFAAGLLAADAELPTLTQKYLICLTREAEGSVRTQKIRAMMIRKDQLLNLPAEMPRLESPLHEVRWQTIKTLARCYAQSPTFFLELEVVIPISSGDDKERSRGMSSGTQPLKLSPADPMAQSKELGNTPQA